MELETVILIKSESQIYDIAYMWNLKYDTNELTYQTDSQTWFSKLTVTKGESR